MPTGWQTNTTKTSTPEITNPGLSHPVNGESNSRVVVLMSSKPGPSIAGQLRVKFPGIAFYSASAKPKSILASKFNFCSLFTPPLNRACPRPRDSLLDLPFAVKKEGHKSLKRLPCPKFGGYDFVITPNLILNHDPFIDQPALRPALPCVYGPVDYREQRALFQRIDAEMKLSSAKPKQSKSLSA